MGMVVIKPGREKSILQRHPWVYSSAIAETIGVHEAGETVDVVDKDHRFLARGAYSPHSQIRVRIWTWDENTQIDAGFFLTQLKNALDLRKSLENVIQSNAMRLVHAESDGIPGLIVDRYADVLVVQFLTSGSERWRDVIVNVLDELVKPHSIYERSDVDVRELEGLHPRKALIKGDEFSDLVQIYEKDRRYWVDVHKGQKTGFYLDQNLNRERIRAFSDGREVLDCFTYTGGFTIAAMAGGASSIVAIDSSAEALSLARKNLALNHFSDEKVEWMEGDVFKLLRLFRDTGYKFDMIILDPPKFAPTPAQVHRASRGYKDINLLAFKLLRPNGLLCTFSCSGGVNEALFQKIVFSAAIDAGVEAQIIERLHQSPDHPIALNFPEGSYLKGLIVRVK
jgi:23S rRNA (cytosine1962-C5)-methyltransferase